MAQAKLADKKVEEMLFARRRHFQDLQRKKQLTEQRSQELEFQRQLNEERRQSHKNTMLNNQQNKDSFNKQNRQTLETIYEEKLYGFNTAKRLDQ